MGGIVKNAIITKINDYTFRFTEYALKVPVYMYLLIGKEKALLIDTAYGFTDVPAAIKSITDKPLIVVNTHGHLDHTHGNHFFGGVYLSVKDQSTFVKHNSKEGMKHVAKELHIPYFLTHFPPVKSIARIMPSKQIPLPDYGFFELGDRKVTIIETPGHTQGSISLLDEKNKWLFSGDMTCVEGVLLNFPESTSVKVFCESIGKIKTLVNDGKVEKLFPSHQQTPAPLEILDAYESAAKRIIEGNISYEQMEKGTYTENKTTIKFDKEKIK